MIFSCTKKLKHFIFSREDCFPHQIILFLHAYLLHEAVTLDHSMFGIILVNEQHNSDFSCYFLFNFSNTLIINYFVLVLIPKCSKSHIHRNKIEHLFPECFYTPVFDGTYYDTQCRPFVCPGSYNLVQLICMIRGSQGRWS